MENNIVFSENGILYDCKEYHQITSTIHIKNQKNYVLNLTYIQQIPNLKMIIENSNVTLLETFTLLQPELDISISIDENSKLQRIALFVEKQKDCKIIRNIQNKGDYQSVQFDLADFQVENEENIFILNQNSKVEVIAGIYASQNNHKFYQTKLNHQVGNNLSSCRIFAICDDYAQVKIHTDAYIKNGAKSAKTTQEGRIINLSSTASGIVLPDLHIDENDVLASHSCSVGSVNQDHLYYLQSRGFTAIEARNLLIKSYFTPILKQIHDEKLKENLTKALDKRMDINGCL